MLFSLAVNCQRAVKSVNQVSVCVGMFGFVNALKIVRLSVTRVAKYICILSFDLRVLACLWEFLYDLADVPLSLLGPVYTSFLSLTSHDVA